MLRASERLSTNGSRPVMVSRPAVPNCPRRGNRKRRRIETAVACIDRQAGGIGAQLAAWRAGSIQVTR